jgi:hypothetical protein
LAAAVGLEGPTDPVEFSHQAPTAQEYRLHRRKIMPKNFILFSRLLLGLLLLATVIYYGWIHWRILWLSEPLTLRESAWIVDVRAYLDPQAARPYTLESIPDYTNVYGMGYIWGAAPFAALLPFSEYANLRLANTFYLGLLLLVLWIGSNKGTSLQRLFGLVLVYAIFISSPSMAASPDILGCLLYTLAWVTAVRGNFKPGALFLSISLAFLALLTKPYFVLAAGAVGSYLFLFRSKKTGLIYFSGVIGLFATGLWLVHAVYPYYFFAAFEVQAVDTNLALMLGLRQWRDFIMLVPVPFCLFAWAIVRSIRKGDGPVRFQWVFTDPFFPKSLPMSPYDWGALVALAVLAGLLSWHSGAYLIYFWHLLLPLLVLGVMSRPAMNPIWPCLNVALLLYLCPSIPPAEASPAWIGLGQLIAKHPNGYVAPYFEPLRPRGSPLTVENAQSENILAAGSVYGPPALSTHCNEFIHGLRDKIRARQFDCLVLVSGGAFLSHAFLPVILENYEIKASCDLRPYYLSFRDRLSFGEVTRPALILTPRKNDKASPAARPKADGP